MMLDTLQLWLTEQLDPTWWTVRQELREMALGKPWMPTVVATSKCAIKRIVISLDFNIAFLKYHNDNKLVDMHVTNLSHPDSLELMKQFLRSHHVNQE